MLWTKYLLVVISLFTSLGLCALTAQVQPESDCADIPLIVTPVDASDQALVCAAAGRTRAFFRAFGVDFKRSIRIHLHEDEIINHANHIGVYDAYRDRIDMVTLQHASNHCNEKPPFDVRMDEALYTSFIIHELAHAIVDQNLEYRPSSLIVPEYLAYVTQFSTMDAVARAQILQRYSISAFAAVEDMSLTYYQLDPNAFGVKSFRHFQRVADKGEFIKRLLSGAIKHGRTQTEW